ncbi:MAG: hypothetical protein NWR39_01510, partial [Pseudomonadota bacterium]|nr:hypothetical protein [Pseudomonadota bacterium]
GLFQAIPIMAVLTFLQFCLLGRLIILLGNMYRVVTCRVLAMIRMICWILSVSKRQGHLDS